MSKQEVIFRIAQILDDLQGRTDDDDHWYLAMHNIREAAWDGKEVIHIKRLAEHELMRRSLEPRTRSSGLSKEDLVVLMKDLGI